jgi:hypothetical protein
MKLSHCICPAFLSKNIGNDTVFFKVFLERLLMSEDQIVLDKEEQLATSYVSSLKEDINGFTNYSTWRKMLDTRDSGKMLISSSQGALSSGEAVYKTISRAATSFGKTIITEDNNHYTSFISEINRQRISLLNLQNLTQCNISSRLKKKPTYEELEADIEWVLQRLGRRSSKSDSEDYNNDYLRDMLLSKHYEAKDQTREGKSTSGLGAGELDIIIEDDSNLFAIIEAMKLNSVDTGYIDTHYHKLLKSYNPANIKRTFLITYYTGSNFETWWGRYFNHIQSLNMSEFCSNSELTITITENISTSFGSIKKLHHHLVFGDEHALCTHLAIKISS